MRRWAVDQLEGLRTGWKSLVDRTLGRFPGIASLFKRGIDGAIDFGQRAVNAAANGLKKGVGLALDGLATFIDVTLAFAEAVTVAALEAACQLAVFGFNLAILLVERDLDALILLVRELPEQPPLGGPLMSVFKAGLIGFLERLRDKPADEKKRFLEKVRWVVISPSFALGYFLGVLKGIVWDGLVGTLRMVWDLVVGLPQALWQMWKLFRRLLEDVEAIREIVAAARAVQRKVAAFLARPDAAEQVIAFLERSPAVLIGLLRQAGREGRAWAYRAGAAGADKLFEYVLSRSHFDMGVAVGTVVGQIVFEVLLAFFSAGAGTAIKVAGKAVQMIARGLRWAVTAAARGGRLILRALRSLRRVAHAGLDLARRLRGKLQGIFASLRRLMDRVFEWFSRQFRRLRRGKKPKKPRRRHRREWRAFILRARALTRRHAVHGVRRAVLSAEIERLQLRYARAVASASVRRRRGTGYLRVRARRRGLPRFFRARVKLDTPTRWRLGRIAVGRRLRRLRRARLLVTLRINRAMSRLRRAYAYKSLTARFEPETNEFVVRGAMNPEGIQAREPAPRPASNRWQALGNRAARVDPLVRGSRYHPPEVWPPDTAAVRHIRTVRGRTSLYVRGHLVSGSLSGPGTFANLTPLTRSANVQMYFQMERRVKRLVRPRRNRGVFSYTVTASGQWGGRPPRRWVRIPPATAFQRVRIAVERNLAATIRMVLRRKRYNPSSGNWIDDRILKSVDLPHRPVYPPGYVPPLSSHPPGGGGGAGSGAAGGGGAP